MTPIAARVEFGSDEVASGADQPEAADRESMTMRTVPQANCPVCGSSGHVAYLGLTDFLYGAQGQWDMNQCNNSQCEAYWLVNVPHPDDLWMAYRNYYTHQSIPTASKESIRSRLRQSLIKRRYGYPGARRPWMRLIDTALTALFPERFESAYYQHFHLPWHPGGRLLEVGCGAGNQLLALKKAGWDVRGVDFDPDAVAAAVSQGLDVRLGDVRDMDLADASFEAIVMGHVIEHVYQPVALLRECQRLLTPGGTLVVITPNAASFGHRMFESDWRGLEPPRHLVVFTPKALQLAFNMAGLKTGRTLFSARDAAHMLETSARIRGAADGEQIDRPDTRQDSRWHLRHLEKVERFGAWARRGWAEEQILLGRKPGNPSTRAVRGAL